MALKKLLAAAAAVMMLQAFAPAPVQAGGDAVEAMGHGVHHVKRSIFIRKHYERYDPYHYHYAPRAYYPYYPASHRLYRHQSGHHHGHNHVGGHHHAAAVYWRPSYQLPRYRYAPGWGYPAAVRNWRWTGDYHHTHRRHMPWHW